MVNDQHPHAGYLGDGAYAPTTHETGSFTASGFHPGHAQSTGHDQSAGYDHGSGYGGADAGYATGSFTPGAFAADPLFGDYPGTAEQTHAAYTATLPEGGGVFPQDPGTAAYPMPGCEGPTADGHHSGPYDTTQWTAAAGYGEYPEYTGQWDATTWADAATQTMQTATLAGPEAPAPQPPAPVYEATAQWDASGYDTGAYSTAAWEYAAAPTETFTVPEQYDYAAADQPLEDRQDGEPAQDAAGDAAERDEDEAPEQEQVHELAAVVPRPARRGSQGGARGRRRTPAKRSALLTVAVPSACVMGVAGIAAASVTDLTGEATKPKTDDKAVTAADTPTVQPVVANRQLDTQLEAFSADARDFGDRASRTQERIDLKVRQETERKKRIEEAARREALRPKFALPVALHQLSARYGQAGVNWMSLHTGIDFPVQYGTPVMAATDGTVRTQWNSAYGNMVIVTAPDGTETWYCHLSSAKIRSGSVKAGETIAYSGNSGNSTGPHLHFEVRPGGGSAIDPLPWLLSHGLNPTG
ncbi:M23 family metallopeptidase [Streptomyces lichenis]|uniref:Peptidoglycan DD-metalloendopeptidase family protein n=1 Tax=Streptomyces lichenis TaxID=2306967 RepID=A0ABT0I7C6_9ACTN|nr:M23 family metallopeptidase [Streptomyces lichenis]MCK8677214.1 peptidoglycan DD-metalloendopeptidase family protein [Streptomyces lichenis]